MLLALKLSTACSKRGAGDSSRTTQGHTNLYGPADTTYPTEQVIGWPHTRARGAIRLAPHTARHDTTRHDTNYITLHHAIPYRTVPYRRTVRYHTLPYKPYHTKRYHTTPYHTIPHHTTPHHTTPYHTIPYHTHHIMLRNASASANSAQLYGNGLQHAVSRLHTGRVPSSPPSCP